MNQIFYYWIHVILHLSKTSGISYQSICVFIFLIFEPMLIIFLFALILMFKKLNRTQKSIIQKYGELTDKNIKENAINIEKLESLRVDLDNLITSIITSKESAL